MERLNEVRFIGNVGKITSGEKSTYVAVACDESYPDKENQGQWIKNTVWVDTIFFGPACDKIKKANVQIGDAVLILGKLRQNEYEGKKYLQVIGQKLQVIQRPDKKDKFPELPTTENTDDHEETEKKDDDLPF